MGGRRSATRGTVRSTALLLALLAAPVAALDPTRPVDQLPRASWSVEQGLPQGSVESLLETADGYLWLGTQEGLARFDGTVFRVFDRSATPELRENVIPSLAETADGSLWVGTLRGLCRLRPGPPRWIGGDDGLPGRGVLGLEAIGDHLWVGTRAGGVAVLSATGELLRVLDTAHGLADDGVWCFAAGDGGEVWVGTLGGVTRVRGDELVSFGREQGLPGVEVRALVLRRDGSVWAGTDQGVARLDGDRFVTVVDRRGLGNAPVYDMLEDSDGALWVASYGGGLLRLSGGRLERLTERDGLPADMVRSLLEDREGSLWVGTAGRGVVRLKDASFATWLPRHGLPHEMVTCVMEDTGGALWVGTFGGGLARFDGRGWTTLTTADGLPSDNVWALAQGRSGELWVGLFGAGLAAVRDGRATVPAAARELAATSARSILEDRAGVLWVTTRDGVNRFSGDRREVLGQAQGMPAASFYALREDGQGRLWVGTASTGLCRLDGERVVAFPEAVGLEEATVYDIYLAGDDHLYLTTNGAGIHRLLDGRWASVTTREGLFDNTGYRLLADDQGFFWVSCNKGIFRVSRSELDEVMDNRRAAVTCQAFGTDDGLVSPEANGGSQPAGWRSRDGRLWWPTTRGLAVVDPARLVVNRVPPPVVIEELVAGGERLPAGAPVRLDPGRTELEVRYAAPSLRSPGRVRCRYRLVGFEDGWVEAGARRVAYYTNLPPGSYRFEVEAVNEDGVRSAAPATLALVLEPPFWVTWWFRLAATAAVAGLAFAAYRWRVRHLERERRNLERLVAERTTELAASHDQLRARTEELEELNVKKNEMLGMAAHDLRGPLGVISGWTTVTIRSLESGHFGPDRAARELTRVVTIAEQLQRLVAELLDLSAIESGVLHFAPTPLDVHAVLDDCAQLHARLAADKGVSLELRPAAGPLLALADRDRLAEVVGNLLSNAIKFTPAGGSVAMWCEVVDGEVVTHVEDSGPGLTADDLERVFRRFGRLTARPTAGEPSTGLGLAIVKKIVDAHGGRVWAASSPGRGARFSFSLPAAPPA